MMMGWGHLLHSLPTFPCAKNDKITEIVSCYGRRTKDAWITSGPRKLSASKLSLGPVAEESDQTEWWRKIRIHPLAPCTPTLITLELATRRLGQPYALEPLQISRSAGVHKPPHPCPPYLSYASLLQQLPLVSPSHGPAACTALTGSFLFLEPKQKVLPFVGRSVIVLCLPSEEFLCLTCVAWSLVHFLIRAHVWVAGLGPGWGA